MGSNRAWDTLRNPNSRGKGKKEDKPCKNCNKKQKENQKQFSQGIIKGEEIRCGLCGKVVFTAKADILPRSLLHSFLLLWYDGTPVQPGDKQVCPHCWAYFRSISTITKRTIF